MRRIPFWKLQAIGNDFPLFHASDVSGVDLRKLAITASDRKFGIGGDGILVAEPKSANCISLRMFNPDGTEDFCGNGLRVAARHAFDQGWVGSDFEIKHLDRVVQAKVSPDGTIQTTLGAADYTPAKVPVASNHELFDAFLGEFDGTPIHGSALTTGSTHTIIPVTELPTGEEIARLGPQIEYAAIFPERTSVIFVREERPQQLQIRIWERGVGETLGCGTGSSAAAADYVRRHPEMSGRIVVNNPGGSISITMDSWNTPLTVEGRAQAVFFGRFEFDLK